ncbi:MAG: hypothetical protein J2P28_11520 [Actinobacteria bacterium]|nr:hypothetical protein [Bradyrhizobiaceae bacterium]MBO0836133.1 hypothetical protein [Actinomycetota bacterium]
MRKRTAWQPFRAGQVFDHKPLSAPRHRADRGPPGLGTAVSLPVEYKTPIDEHTVTLLECPHVNRVNCTSHAVAMMQASPRKP